MFAAAYNMELKGLKRDENAERLNLIKKEKADLGSSEVCVRAGSSCSDPCLLV
jgi:hypothetical protein